MNTMAIIIGLLLGLLSAGVCYGVSMLTSGLFARPFYRLYARVLIGICCVMLLAPALRILSAWSPIAGTIALGAAQYVAVGVLAYGVYRFNRDYLRRVFLRRASTTYFIFGTLAYATIVTLAFLHLAVRATPAWVGQGHGFLTAGHYGPLLIVLAAMIFYTDSCLKFATKAPRAFSRFTFVGYAVSLLGLAVSTVPFIADGFDRLSAVAVEAPWMRSLSSAEGLLIAIVLYGWLVWRYESIPPLFLLLASLIAEYHVLVTQWALQAFGPECWGLASLPLFAGIAYLDHYFGGWDERKQRSRARHGLDTPSTDVSLRFAAPFSIVQWGLAAALLAVTFWTRFYSGATSPTWLLVTFTVYGVFFAFLSVARGRPGLVYLAGALAGLAGLFGFATLGSPTSALWLTALALVAGLLAVFGEWRGLKLKWRTPLADVSLVAASLVIVLGLSRHLPGGEASWFRAVGWVDMGALLGASVALILCALQYRSRIPVFGVLVAAVTMFPLWSAGIGLLATIAATLIDQRVKASHRFLSEDRTLLAGRIPLPLEDQLPRLLSRPLSLGGIPLALLGLATSAFQLLQGDDSLGSLTGAAVSALVLLLLTRSYRRPWLYVTGLLATYFAVHAWMQSRLVEGLPPAAAWEVHLLTAAMISLFGWFVASGNASWCNALLRRCAEDREDSVRARRDFYSGWLYHVTSIVSMLTLVGVWMLWIGSDLTLGTGIAASALAVLFAMAAPVYRTQIASYLSLIALTLSVFCVFQWLDVSFAPFSTVLAGLALTAGLVSWLWCGVQKRDDTDASSSYAWLPTVPILPARGLGLWVRPLATYALVATPIAVVSSLQAGTTWSIESFWTRPVPLTYLFAGITLLLSSRTYRERVIYLTSIALLFAAGHATAQLALNSESLTADPLGVHLLVGSVLALVGCLVAMWMTWYWNRKLERADADGRSSLINTREFYAGSLHHFTLAVAGVASITLVGTLFFEPNRFVNSDWIFSLAASISVVSFVLFALAYRSRLVPYGAIVSFAVLVLGLVSTQVQPENLLIQSVLASSSLALGFGVASWVMLPREHRESKDSDQAEGAQTYRRFNRCWERPPLPLVANDRSLWAKPLTHASNALALVALLPLISLWKDSPVWMVVTPIFAASLTWLIATFTYGIGFISWMDHLASSSKESGGAQASEVMERSILYLMSLVSFGAAVHLTAQLTYVATMPARDAIAWHLLIATGLAMLGWCVATAISMRMRSGLEEAARPAEKIRLRLYAGLLHHVALLTGVVALLIAAIASFGTLSLSMPLVVASGILVLLFAAAAGSYRSEVGSYLSLAAIGLLTWQFVGSIGGVLGPPPLSIAASSYALLGLLAMVMAVLAGRSSRLQQGSDEALSTSGRLMPASAWVESPLPLRASSWPSLWNRPLRNWGVLFATLGVAFVALHVIRGSEWGDWAGPSVIALLGAAVASLFASKLYRESIFTYVATGLVALAVFPLLPSWTVGNANLGIAWSIVAVLFWIGGYLIEWRSRAAAAGEADQSGEGTAVGLYERPLIRSSTLLAVVAICQSLVVWTVSPTPSLMVPLLVTVAAGTLALLLNARSLNVMRRFSLGRMVVYLACSLLTAVCCTVALTSGDPESIGPVVAMLALTLAVIGLTLLEWARIRGLSEPHSSSPILTFAVPLSNFASWIAIGASALSAMVAIRAGVAFMDQEAMASIAAWIDSLPRGPVALTFTVSAVVSLLTVRAFKQLFWLDASIVLGTTGLLLIANDFFHGSTATLTVAALIVMNGLVFIARWVRIRPARLEALLGLKEARLDQSFFRWPLVVATTCLALQAASLALAISGTVVMDLGWPWLLTGILSCLLFFHVMYLQPTPLLLHLIVSSTVVAFFGACLSRGWDITTDVALSVMGLFWGLIAVQANRPLGDRILSIIRLPMTEAQETSMARALFGWALGMATVAGAITLPIHWLIKPEFPSLPVTILCAAMTYLIVGVRKGDVSSTIAAAVLTPIGLASAALLYVDPSAVREFAGFAISSLGLVYLISESVVRRRSGDPPSEYARETGRSLYILAHLSVAAGVVLTIGSMVALQPSIILALAMLLVSVSWLWMAWESGREWLVYSSAAAVFTALLYVCTSLLGLTLTRSPLAAFAVIGYSFALYGLNIVLSRAEHPRAKVFLSPTYHMALLSPLALLVVTPMDQKAVAAFIFLAAGAFYLVVSQRSHARWTMYVAAALFNVAVYLWIPEARELTGLVQLYVIPAAITVLILAQLHRKDLKPRALNGIRSAAAGAILAVSTFEVFFAKEAGLLPFVAVLLLSLAGTATGIALRIRPFVSIGIAFLVINVVGQLGLQFHREGGIIRAVILIGVGLVVLATMIFFNIHRERIMRRYRGFLAEENWK